MLVTDEVVRRVEGRLGTTICGKWRLEHVLGIGGMAAVYAAVHRNQNRVAIKMLHPEQSLNPTIKTRFLREGYVANTVDHPGAVRVQDDGITEDGAPFFVMELLDGESLEERRQRFDGSLPVWEVLAIAEQLLEVLVAAHERGILHRDIKPENLFLTTRGELKVLDFGIARLQEHTLPSGNGTSVGTFMGTPPFMSPEQARARWNEVDERSDVWSVGATIFTLISGRLVHDAETVTEQLAHAIRDPAPPLASVCDNVPAEVARIVDKALSFGKRDRFSTAWVMLEAVRGVMHKSGRSLPLADLVAADERTRRINLAREGSDLIETILAPSYQPLVLRATPSMLGRGVQGASTQETGGVRRAWYGLGAIALLLTMGGGAAFFVEGRTPEPVAPKTFVQVRALQSPAAVQALAIEPLPIAELPAESETVREPARLAKTPETAVDSAPRASASARPTPRPRTTQAPRVRVEKAPDPETQTTARTEPREIETKSNFFDKRF